ncbi:MAG: DUF1810 domain-containing protein [Hyphomicrobiaceae bacterium]
MFAKNETGLDRFLEAQAPVFEAVCDELRSGQKRSHWMWYVFPQMRELGSSPQSQFYGINSRSEARAYLAHVVLGARLRQCVEMVLAVEDKSAGDIFDAPDDLKFQSSMTLFDAVSPREVFELALNQYYLGRRHEATLKLLS